MLICYVLLFMKIYSLSLTCGGGALRVRRWRRVGGGGGGGGYGALGGVPLPRPAMKLY